LDFFGNIVYYFFIDETVIESPTWLIAAVACWYYRDYLEKEEKNKANTSKE
jgi:hypothetical protein